MFTSFSLNWLCFKEKKIIRKYFEILTSISVIVSNAKCDFSENVRNFKRFKTNLYSYANGENVLHRLFSENKE